MAGFWDEHDRRDHEDTLERGGQGDTTGVCDFCGLASDDVLIGVCGDCAEGD